MRGQVQLTPFTSRDDAEIRELLREAPMDGRIRLSFEREPRTEIANRVEGDPHHVFVARHEQTGELLGFCSRAVKRVWWRGNVKDIGYLGHLRTRSSFQPRLHHLVEGFRACATTRLPEELPFDFTAILEDNSRARRLLERGLPGLPRYEPWCELETLSIRVRSPRKLGSPPLTVRRGSQDLLPTLVEFLRRVLKRCALAPAWSLDDFRQDGATSGLKPEDFHLAYRGEELVGCLALWDQRSFKQTRIRGYGPRLKWGRPFLNLWSSWTGGPHLPTVGQTFRYAFLSHLALEENDPQILGTLVDFILASVAQGDLDALVIAFPTDHPLLPFIKRCYTPHSLRSLIYTVHYEASSNLGNLAHQEPPYLEAATL